jgi:sugar O-acyltransferase (sialic acid O-acetyltransferase NeuD family)
MHTDRIRLLGAGGHASVVFDAMLAIGLMSDNILIHDDAAVLYGADFFGLEIRPMPDRSDPCAFFHVAIGCQGTRRLLYERMSGMSMIPLTVVHPKALISPFSQCGEGSFVAGMAVLAPRASIGRGVIVNHGAIIDHACLVGDFTHIAPNATLGGSVCIGSDALVGSGAIVLPGVKIGSRVVVGAGSVVTKDVPDDVQVVGVPAQRIYR